MDVSIVKLRDEVANNNVDQKYFKQIFLCYSALTNAPVIPWNKFTNIINNSPPSQETYIYKIENAPVGIITLYIEQKLINSGGLVAHIEDLSIKPENQKQGIGKTLIEYCINIARQTGCYKIILDCKQELLDFYKKHNFVNEGHYMCYRIV